MLVSMLTPSENDTARYEAIIRIRRDRTRSALYFDVVLSLIHILPNIDKEP